MKVLAKLAGSQSIAILLIFISCLAIFAGFLWQNQQITSQYQQAIGQKQGHIADIIHSAVEAKITSYNQQMSAAAESPQLATIITGQDSDLIASQQRALMRILPGVSQVCLIEASVDEPNSEACIPVTFATLNSLRIAKETGSAPIAAMKTAQGDSYLLLTQSIKNSQGLVVGVLAVTMSNKVVQQLLQPSFSSEGYVELQQGANTVTALTSQGEKKWRQGPPLFNKPLAKSHWRIAYWPAVNQISNSYILVMAIVLAIVLLMWLLRERSQRFVLLKDLSVLKMGLKSINYQFK